MCVVTAQQRPRKSTRSADSAPYVTAQAHGLALAAVKASLKPHLRHGGLDRAAFRSAAEAATKVHISGATPTAQHGAAACSACNARQVCCPQRPDQTWRLHCL